MAIREAVVIAAKSGAAGFFKSIGNILGGQPRGDLQKFNRSVGPLAQAQADLAKRSVFVFWFGDLLEVKPGGQVVLMARPGTLGNANTVVRQIAKERATQILVFRCAADVDFNSIDDVARKCSFEPVGQAGFFERIPEKLPGAEPHRAGIGGAQIAGIAAVGLAVLFAGRR